MANHSEPGTRSQAIATSVRILSACVALGLLWIPLQGARKALRQYLGNLPTYQFPIDRVAATPVPDWIVHDVHRSVMSKVSCNDSKMIVTDESLTEHLANAFLASPWISSAQVQKQFDSLTVDLEYRKPVLCVPCSTGDGRREGCYVDGHGVLLPAGEADPKVFRDCFVVEGLERAVLSAIGQPAQDAALADVAGLAARLAPFKHELQLLVIIVASEPSEPCAVLMKTRGGSRIVWGTLDRTEEKLRHLLDVGRRLGSLDRSGEPHELDLASRPFGEPVRIVDKRRQR